MTTDVDIANMALGHLGTKATISDLAENSTESREIVRWYAPVRDSMLSALDWNFARVYQQLATGTAPIPSRWGFAYAYPSDCLKFWRVDMGTPTWFPVGPNPPFEVATDGTNRFIFCNISQAIGVYTQRVTDPNRFEPDFINAFAVGLASLIALPLTQKQDLKRDLGQEAKGLIETAMASSANEQTTTDSERVAASIATRGYDYFVDPNYPWTLR